MAGSRVVELTVATPQYRLLRGALFTICAVVLWFLPPPRRIREILGRKQIGVSVGGERS